MREQTRTDKLEELSPLGKQPGGLAGDNARGETAGCPTGLTDPTQATIAQQPGGGGAPTTGTADPSVPLAPGEGISHQQARRSGAED